MYVGVLREKCQIYKPTLYIMYWKFKKKCREARPALCILTM